MGVGAHPAYSDPYEGLAYASWDASFYVATPPSSVDVISASTERVSAVLSVGTDPFGVAVDPSTQQVFVTNSGSDNVSVIAGTTPRIVASVPVQTMPMGIAVDEANGTVYAANNGSNTVTVFSAGSFAVLGNLTVGTNPYGVAWDAATDRIFVTDHGANEVSELLGTRLVGTLPVGTGPFGLAVDTVSDQVYVTNEGSDNVTVFAATNGTQVSTITVGTYAGLPTDLQGVAYDPLDGWIFVGAGHLFALAINTRTQTIGEWIGSDPSAVAVDSATGNVCFTNTANRTFGCFLFANRTGSTTYAVTFVESGLAAGTNWSVDLSGSFAQSPSNQILFTEPNGTYFYSASVLASGCYSTARGSVVVAGGPITVGVLLARIPCGPPCYGATFGEAGLLRGANWSVTLTSGATTFSQWSVGSQIAFLCVPLANPTYDITPPPGYTANPSHGRLNLSTSNVSVPVVFAPTVPLFAGANWTILSGGSCTQGQGMPIVITFRGYASGGVPPYAYTWVFGNGSEITYAPNTTYAFGIGPEVGPPEATLTVTDAVGHLATWTLPTLAYSCPSVPPAFFLGGAALVFALTFTVGAVLLIIVVAVAVVVSRPPTRPGP